MKLSIVTLIVFTFIVSNYVSESPDLVAPSSPIALVKYKDTVYQCSKVVVTDCGHSISCGELSVRCANNITVEWL